MSNPPTKVHHPKAQTPFTFSLDTPSLSSGTLDRYLKSVLGEDSVNAIPELLRPSNTETVSNKKDPDQPIPSQTDSDKTSNAPTGQPSSPITTSTTPTNTLPLSNAPSTPQATVTNIVHQVQPTPVSGPQDMNIGSNDPQSMQNQQLATTGNDSNELIPVPRGQNYVDITEYLNMPQADAAKKLGIPPSTLSKRWKEAVRKRKWPYRMICKIDKEIMTLLHNVPQGPNAPPLPEEIETALGISLRKRQEELRPVVIRI